MLLYNRPKSNQVDEIGFRMWLLNAVPHLHHEFKHYSLDVDIHSTTLEPHKILRRILESPVISLSKKAHCNEYLSTLPQHIKLAMSISKLSVDFALVHQNGKVKFLEFHEDQHSIEYHQRYGSVYSVDGDEIKVPRHLQRLLRDIWRWKYLANYTIIWKNWFNKHRDSDPALFVKAGQYEYSLPNTIRISEIANY